MESNDEKQDNIPSCAEGMTRKEFLQHVTRKAKIAGVLLTSAAIADQFLVPPTYAKSSSPVGGHETAPGQDTTANFTDVG